MSSLEGRWPGWRAWRPQNSLAWCAGWGPELSAEQEAAGWARVAAADELAALERLLAVLPNRLDPAR
ncbi:hypothetical protein ACFWYW_14695 [Nonomuraea sp. NPDC059023]|uniref:hypothetical protein n=1 Tax=unclassified Nonomuraea TaxID=2593643 RepID=UPI0036806C82